MGVKVEVCSFSVVGRGWKRRLQKVSGNLLFYRFGAPFQRWLQSCFAGLLRFAVGDMLLQQVGGGDS